MSTRPLRSFVTTLAVFGAISLSSLFADDFQSASILKIERPLGTSIANNSAPSVDSKQAIMLESGKTTLIVKLSSTEPISALSFLNSGAKGQVSVFSSNVNLQASSRRWQQVAINSLTDGVIKSLVRPNEARYLKVTFEVTQPGQISNVGVYATATVASKHAKHYALLAADSNAVESDGKAVVDGKDLGDAKDIPSEGEEAPAEGPAPGLPAPPPFTFVPVLVPTSP